MSELPQNLEKWSEFLEFCSFGLILNQLCNVCWICMLVYCQLSYGRDIFTWVPVHLSALLVEQVADQEVRELDKSHSFTCSSCIHLFCCDEYSCSGG